MSTTVTTSSDEKVLAGRLLSTLDANQRTYTPAYVLHLARLCSYRARRKLGLGPLVVKIAPYHTEKLQMYLVNERGAKFTLEMRIGTAYEERASDWDLQEWASIPSPDFVEALHIAGIVLHDLDASIDEIGDRTQEFNPAVLAAPPKAPAHAGLRDDCDHSVPFPADALPAVRAINCVFFGDSVFTPVEIFNWGARVVDKIRERISGKHVLAHLWGFRYTERTVDDTGDGPWQRFVVDLWDESGSSFEIPFVIGSQHNFATYLVVVPDFQQALHMAGMLLHALNAKVVRVGCRLNEANSEVANGQPGQVDRPVEIVRASNFVEPIGMDSWRNA